MSTKEIKEFTSKLNKKSKSKSLAKLEPPKFPEPFFENDSQYMKGFKSLMNKFQLEYETFNLKFLVERIKQLQRKDNSILMFNKRLKQDLALIVNKTSKNSNVTSSQNDQDKNEHISSRLRPRRNDLHKEMSSGSFSITKNSTTINDLNANKQTFSYSYILRSSKLKSSLSSSSTLTNSKQNKNKRVVF